MRVPVLSPEGQPLMQTLPSRARRWLKSGKAKVVHNDLGIFTVQLVFKPSGTETQPISVGIDPGKLYTGYLYPHINNKQQQQRYLLTWFLPLCIIGTVALNIVYNVNSDTGSTSSITRFYPSNLDGYWRRLFTHPTNSELPALSGKP